MQLLGQGHKAEFWHPRQALVIWSDQILSVEPEVVNASVVDRRGCCLCCLQTQVVSGHQGRHTAAALIAYAINKGMKAAEMRRLKHLSTSIVTASCMPVLHTSCALNISHFFLSSSALLTVLLTSKPDVRPSLP